MEIRPLVPTEIPTLRQEQFLKALSALPKNGIAYRGDPIRRIRQIQQNGLTDKQSNYIPLIPPNLIPKVWGKEPQETYRNLWAGINYALSFADGIGSNAFNFDVAKFKDFYTYFENNQESLPGISVFTAFRNQFIDASKKGATFFGPAGTELKVGSVDKFGTVPKENVKAPVVLSLDDIKKSEEQIIEELMSNHPDEAIKKIAISKLYESSGALKSVMTKLALKRSILSFSEEEQQKIKTEYLKHKKDMLFAGLTNIAIDRLVEEIIHGLD